MALIAPFTRKIMIKNPSITTLRNSSKPFLNIVRGIPGSGKTTLAKGMASINNRPTVVLSADMYFCRETGKYEFDVEKLRRAHYWCFNDAKTFLHDGVEVFVANTFMNYRDMSDYFEFAVNNDFGICLLTAHNDFGSVHNLTEERMQEFRNKMKTHDFIVKLFDETYSRTDNDLNQ